VPAACLLGVCQPNYHHTACSLQVCCVLVLPLVNIVPWIQKSELQPHGLLTTASRFFLAYQVRPHAAHVACPAHGLSSLRLIRTLTLRSQRSAAASSLIPAVWPWLSTTAPERPPRRRMPQAVQVLFLIAVFTTLASVVLRDQPPEWLRAALAPALLALCLCPFLVTLYSGGLRSRDAHAHLQLPPRESGASGDGDASLRLLPPHPRRSPESVLSHAVSLEEVLSSLRGGRVGSGAGGARLVGVERSGDSLQRTYVVDAYASEELPDGAADAALDAMAPLLRHSGYGGPGAAASPTASERSATSYASEVYHEQPAADLAPLQLLHAAEFHLLVFCCFVTMGGALALLNNLVEMLYALSPLDPSGHPRVDRELSEALVVCFSVSNTLGRIAAGYCSELALHRAVRACA
jgi:hypothetical protein